MQNLTADNVILQVTFMFCMVQLSTNYITDNRGWKPGYLALGCQFRCVETQMSGFSFGLASRLLKNRFQFRFQFCLHTTSVSGF